MTIYTWPDPGQDESNIVGGRLADQMREIGIPAYSYSTAKDAALAEIIAQDRIESFDVRGYGAKGDGSTDDTDAIQEAIDAAGDAGGGVVFIPEGVYRITSFLDIGTNVEVRGTGAGSIIRQATSDTDGVRFNAVSDAALRNVKVDGIVSTGGEIFNVVVVNNCQRCTIEGVVCDDISDAGISVRGSSSFSEATEPDDTRIINCTVLGPSTQDSGIEVIHANRTLVEDCLITGAIKTWGIRVVGSRNTQVVANRVVDVAKAGIHIQDGSSQADENTVVVGNVITGAGTAGVTVSGCRGAVVSGNMVDLEGSGTGVGLGGTCEDSLFSGNVIRRVARGFDLDATVLRCRFSGNVLDDVFVDSGTAYGFFLDGTQFDDVVIAGNHISNPSAGAGDTLNTIRVLSNESSSTVYILDNTYSFASSATNNRPAVDEGLSIIRGAEGKNGTATLANGTTSIAVTHGLGVTPDIQDISVTPIEAWGTATQFWISTPTSTQFTITVDQDPGQDVDFAWTASVQ